MKITLSSRWLLVNIKKDTSYSKMIRAFVEQNFKRVVNLSDTLIIFNEDSELRKKKQLLFWLSNAYKKLNSNTLPSFLDSIKKAETVPIKVKFLSSSEQLSASLVLILRKSYEEENRVTLQHQNILVLKHFLRVFFKDSSLIDTKNGEFSILIDKVKLVNKLKDLVTRKKILNFQVSFKYDFFVRKLLQGSSYKKREKKFKEQERVVKKYKSEVESAFLFLNSSLKDDFKTVKKRYLILAKKYHPDSVYENENLVQEYTREFQRVQEAFNIIKAHFKS